MLSVVIENLGQFSDCYQKVSVVSLNQLYLIVFKNAEISFFLAGLCVVPVLYGNLWLLSIVSFFTALVSFSGS